MKGLVTKGSTMVLMKRSVGEACEKWSEKLGKELFTGVTKDGFSKSALYIALSQSGTMITTCLRIYL